MLTNLCMRYIKIACAANVYLWDRKSTLLLCSQTCQWQQIWYSRDMPGYRYIDHLQGRLRHPIIISPTYVALFRSLAWVWHKAFSEAIRVIWWLAIRLCSNVASRKPSLSLVEDNWSRIIKTLLLYCFNSSPQCMRHGGRALSSSSTWMLPGYTRVC